MRSFGVTESSQVAQTRRAVSALAVQNGFDVEDAGRAALVATEICSNLIKHGGGGELVARSLEHDGRLGIEMLGLDRGPGMLDVAKCLRDGFSTGGSPGTGLGAIERMSQQFDIYSQPDRGTALMAQLWAGGRAPQSSSLEIGALVIPLSGESESGDSWCYSERAGGALVLGVDGLGHGLGASQAAKEACRVFEAEKHRAPAALLQLIHTALRPTRGAAVSLLDVDWQQGQVTAAGIGNVVATILTGGIAKRIASDNGIVGHVVSKFRELIYPCAADSVLIMHSDGLGTSWQLERYPGLLQHHCALVAGVLYRDYKRGRDDSLIVVMRRARA
jgi:anti-sigma regulatory factor (Ser/Thr protein kinase)